MAQWDWKGKHERHRQGGGEKEEGDQNRGTDVKEDGGYTGS